MSYEVELIALAILLYLYDASVLLYSNEAVLTCDRAGRWSATSAWMKFAWAGRTLCVLNPFTPGRPSFRLHWNFSAMECRAEDRLWPDRVREFNKLAPFCLGAGVALYAILPLGMFTSLGPYVIVPALVLLYGSLLLGLIQLRRLGISAALGRRRFWGIVFESMACPPFGVNMVRHITLANRIHEPLPLAAVRLLSAAQWGRLRDRCISLIDDAIELAADNSSEQEALEKQKLRLNALVART